MSSSSRQGVGSNDDDDVSAAAELKSHSASLSRAREMALLRCLRAREAARAGGGETNTGEIEDMMMI